MLYAAVLCFLLMVLLTVLALRRPDTRRKALRLGAGALAAAGLGLTAFPPQQSSSPEAARAAVLLTDGYSPDTLRAVLRQLGSSARVWRYAAHSTPDTPTVSTVAALRQQLAPTTTSLHILGRGLPAADAALLPAVPVRLHAAGAGAGFGPAAWLAQPELGQPWLVEGAFRAAETGPVWVRLVAAGAARDSVLLPTGRGSYRLRFTPRAEGRAVYQVQARHESQVLAQEPLPVEVQPSRPLRVLVLAAAPSFEIRFLKNELAARQHQVALRVGISRGLTQTEFLNLPAPLTLDRLSARLLAQFEVVVLDATTLAALPAEESRTLAQAVAAGRCNVLLLADGATVPRQLPGGGAFRLLARPANSPGLPLAGLRAGAPVVAPASYALLPSPALQPLLAVPGQPLAVAHRRVGLGQVAVTTILETFPWLLQQQAATYHAYWSQLLTAVRSAAVAPALRVLTPWPVPNAPVVLQTEGVAPATPLRITGPAAAVRLALLSDATVPEWATAPYWPAAAGWHQAQAGRSSLAFYVYAPADWQLARQLAWQQAVQARPAPARGLVGAAEPGTTPVTTWPRWLGVLLFVAGAGLLWLEEKL